MLNTGGVEGERAILRVLPAQFHPEKRLERPRDLVVDARFGMH